MTDTPNLPVDDLRQKLKDLGYLQTPVDRFVLAPARQQRSAIRIAAAASMRIGVLAAALLGPAAAIGIAARLPQLVTGPRDAIVVALYLALLFGAAATAVAFAVALGARTVARATRRPRLTLAVASGLVSAVCLAYLALWWSAVSAGPAWRTPLWTTVALSLAVAVSFLLGHAVAAMTAAVTALDSAGTRPLEAAWRPGPFAFIVRVAAFAATAGLLLATARPAGEDVLPDAASEFAIVPTGQRVVVVGIDGLDDPFEIASAYVARAVGHAADAQDTDPARVWTTVATGVPAARHGISALELRRVAGLEGAVATGESRSLAAIAAATDLLRLTRPAIASGFERKVKTFWEVAAEKGLSTAVVNWWATWPAVGPGVVLSDRALLRLEQAGAQDAEIWPPELYPRIRDGWSKLTYEARALALRAFSRIERQELRSVLVRSAELDATVTLLAAQPALGAKDLLAFYLPGLDIAQHALARADSTPSASALAGRAEAVRVYCEFLDALLRRFTVGNRTLLVLVTHPGRVSTAAPGKIVVQGWVASPAAGRLHMGYDDVAPTVLYALGVPASRDLSGHPRTALFTAGFVRNFPPRTVETYGPRLAAPAARGGKPLDQEMIDRLRSLGYVR